MILFLLTLAFVVFSIYFSIRCTEIEKRIEKVEIQIYYLFVAVGPEAIEKAQHPRGRKPERPQ